MAAGSAASRKIWIDLDNSPHVPFFAPIIEELEKRGYKVFLTARDAYQVSDLVDLFHLPCKRVGRHYGKHKLLKVLGSCYRALQLISVAYGKKLALAVSHGSRSQMIAAFALRIPSVLIFDYEFASSLTVAGPSWVMTPDVVPANGIPVREERILKYPGIKEDVYVPRFRPDPAIRPRLGLQDDDLVVTVRPPANEAHYHNPESDVLFHAVIEFLGKQPALRTVILPRNERQANSIKHLWPQLLKEGKVIVPEHVVDGLNLLWFSDLAISGGGTMNREAAALGVPVYSIFRGTIGAVDHYLANTGRLILLESVDDIYHKINLSRRERPPMPGTNHPDTLHRIVENIVSIVES